MTRALSAGMQTEIAAQSGQIAHLFSIDSDAGLVRLATTPVDVLWDSQTWEGIGGSLVFGSAEETPDPAGQGLQLTLSGVDQTFIAVLLSANMRGREVRIWLVHFSATYTIVADPLEIFRGRQLAEYRITEDRPSDGPGSVTVTTRVQSQIGGIRGPEAVLTNEVSHNDMLKRAGLATGDTFFRNTLGIAGRFIQWGPFLIGDRGKAIPR